MNQQRRQVPQHQSLPVVHFTQFWTNCGHIAHTKSSMVDTNIQGGPFIYPGFHLVITLSFYNKFFRTFYTTCPHIKNFVSEKIVKVWWVNHQLYPISEDSNFGFLPWEKYRNFKTAQICREISRAPLNRSFWITFVQALYRIRGFSCEFA